MPETSAAAATSKDTHSSHSAHRSGRANGHGKTGATEQKGEEAGAFQLLLSALLAGNPEPEPDSLGFAGDPGKEAPQQPVSCTGKVVGVKTGKIEDPDPLPDEAADGDAADSTGATLDASDPNATIDSDNAAAQMVKSGKSFGFFVDSRSARATVQRTIPEPTLADTEGHKAFVDAYRALQRSRSGGIAWQGNTRETGGEKSSGKIRVAMEQKTAAPTDENLTAPKDAPAPRGNNAPVAFNAFNPNLEYIRPIRMTHADPRSEDATPKTDATASAISLTAERLRADLHNPAFTSENSNSFQSILQSDRSALQTRDSIQSFAADAPKLAPIAARAMELIADLRGKVLARPAKGEASIRLDPPELGSVEIEIRIDEANRLHATLRSESAGAGLLLHEHVEDLRKALAGAGIDFANFRHEGGARHQDTRGEGHRQQPSLWDGAQIEESLPNHASDITAGQARAQRHMNRAKLAGLEIVV